MFVQSLSIEKAIEEFRRERIKNYDHLTSAKKNKYLILHIFPDTFMDSSYNKPLFILENKGEDFSTIYDRFECATRSMPMVEGLRYKARGSDAECCLLNNGISECYYPISSKVIISDYFPTGFLDWEASCYDILWTIKKYIEKAAKHYITTRLFVCISIVGCMGVITDRSPMYPIIPDEGMIDRNYLYINPIVIENANEFSLDCIDAQRIKYEFMIALGIKYDKGLKGLIKELYGE